MSNVKEQPNFTNTGAVINFVYFLYNFRPGIHEIIKLSLEKHGDHFVKHVQDKLTGFIGDDSCCRPEHIIKLLMSLNTEYQKDIIDWVNENYNAGWTGNGLTEDE